MLIFTRRIGQTLKIGDDISLTVLAINRNEVRIHVNVATIQFTLTSGVGQTLSIGDDVTVTVLVTRQKEIRMGIEAGANTPVYRSERDNRLGLYGDDASQRLI